MLAASVAGRNTLLFYDDPGGRREMYRLLGDRRLGDSGRLAFIGWCAKKASARSPILVKPSAAADGYPAREAALDLCMLTLQYGLDADLALAELARRVRRL